MRIDYLDELNVFIFEMEIGDVILSEKDLRETEPCRKALAEVMKIGDIRPYEVGNFVIKELYIGFIAMERRIMLEACDVLKEYLENH